MLTKYVFGTLCTTLIATSLLAQEPPKKVTPPRARIAHMSGIELPVTGLTKETSAKVETSLKTLTYESFMCPGCKAVSNHAGECKKCEMALEAKQAPVFSESMPNVEKNHIALRLTPGAQIALTRLESTLGDTVKVQREKLHVGGNTTLVFQGAKDEKEAQALQAAFREAKLQDATATYDAKAKQIHLHIARGNTSWETASELAQKTSKDLRLADLLWSSPVMMPRG